MKQKELCFYGLLYLKRECGDIENLYIHALDRFNAADQEKNKIEYETAQKAFEFFNQKFCEKLYEYNQAKKLYDSM